MKEDTNAKTTLSEKMFWIEGRGGHANRLYAKDVRLSMLEIFDKIRLAQNRDDSIVPMGEHKLKLGILDGGGIGKQEVMNIIKEEVGAKLI